MIEAAKKVSNEDLISLKCSLGYTQALHTLIMVAQKKDVIPEVKVVIDL